MYKGRRVPLEAMQYQATEGVQHEGCSISPWRYIFFNLGNRIQRPVKDTAEEIKEPLRIKMENFKKRRSKKLIDTHKITCKAGGRISRMPSPADVDLLDY